MTLSPSDHALQLSVYNPDLTTDTLLKFPLGAPIFTGMDAELEDGFALYRFGRSEHRECRVFVQQSEGIVSLKELPPVSTVYHRRLYLSGLENATVCIFPDKRSEGKLGVDKDNTNIHYDWSPEYDDRFHKVEDPIWGVYYRAEQISGNYTLLLPGN